MRQSIQLVLFGGDRRYKMFQLDKIQLNSKILLQPYHISLSQKIKLVQHGIFGRFFFFFFFEEHLSALRKGTNLLPPPNLIDSTIRPSSGMKEPDLNARPVGRGEGAALSSVTLCVGKLSAVRNTILQGFCYQRVLFEIGCTLYFGCVKFIFNSCLKKNNAYLLFKKSSCSTCYFSVSKI